MTTREVLHSLACKLVGVPYIWGGKHPSPGLDCSGFVCWCLQVVHALDTVEMDAQGLYEYFVERSLVPSVLDPAGDLAFYGRDSSHVTHVMMYLSDDLVIGATGGDHTTITLEEARKRGAMVKIEPAKYRSDLVSRVYMIYADDPKPGVRS